MTTQLKKQLYRHWTRLRAVQPVHLLILIASFSVISVVALRNNYQTMVELRQAVYVADKNNGDVELALRELRQHVYAHMNTNLSSGSTGVYPPIQLKHTYDRYVEAELAKTRQSSQQIYSQAQAHCERLHPESFSGGPRVPCIRDYVARQGVATKTIPDSLYKFNFVSPRWSPDVAGWSLVATVCTIFVLIVRLVAPIARKKLRI